MIRGTGETVWLLLKIKRLISFNAVIQPALSGL
jgi:hypothetical protein